MFGFDPHAFSAITEQVSQCSKRGSLHLTQGSPLRDARLVHHLADPDSHAWVMAEPVRVRRLTDEEGHKLQRLVRRG
jgi:hypothetical protein